MSFQIAIARILCSVVMRNRKPILVTGGTGFIGAPVSRALERLGYAVHEGPRRDLLNAKERATLIEEAGAESMIHLAWETEHGKFWTSSLNAVWEEASIDLFRRFYQAGGRRVVGTGSCAEYDWTTCASVFNETDPLLPHTAYGAAKARTAQALDRLSEQYGGTAVWARLFFMFGPGEPRSRLLPLMIQAARSGIPVDCGPSDTVRDFWHVDRLAQGLALLAISDLEGPVNLGAGSPIRFDELAAMIEEEFDAPGTVRCDRRSLGKGEPRSLVAGTQRSSLLGLPKGDFRADLLAYCRIFDAT